MDHRAPSPAAQAAYQAVADELAATAGIKITRMFGLPTLKDSGKAFAGLHADAMMFKLTGGPHAEALALPGARLFDPMGGRPMREWVEVPVAHAAGWPALARAALAYRRSKA